MQHALHVQEKNIQEHHTRKLSYNVESQTERLQFYPEAQKAKDSILLSLKTMDKIYPDQVTEIPRYDSHYFSSKQNINL
jgi:hypothetical protein